MAIVSARRDITKNLAGFEISQVRLQGLGWPDFLDDAVGYVKDKAVDAGSFVVDTAKKGGELAWEGAKGAPGALWGGGKYVVGKTVGFVKEHPALLLATPLAPFYATSKVLGAMGGKPDAPPPPAPAPETIDAAEGVARLLSRRIRTQATADAAAAQQSQNQAYATTAAQGDSGLTNQQQQLIDPAAAAAAAAEQMASEGPTGFAAWPTWQKIAVIGGGLAALGFVGWKLTHRRGGGRTKS